MQDNEVLLSPREEDPSIMEDVITASDERETGGESIEITVEEPQKMGDGIQSYLVYK